MKKERHWTNCYHTENWLKQRETPRLKFTKPEPKRRMFIEFEAKNDLDQKKKRRNDFGFDLTNIDRIDNHQQVQLHRFCVRTEVDRL